MQKSIYKRWWVWMLVLITMGSLFSSCAKKDPEGKADEIVVKSEGVNGKDKSRSVDSHEAGLLSEEELLAKLKETTEHSSPEGKDDVTVTCESLSYDEDTLTVVLQITGNPDLELRSFNVAHMITSLTAYLQDYGDWKNFVFKLPGYEDVTLHDSEKEVVSDDLYYFDYEMVINRVQEAFGLDQASDASLNPYNTPDFSNVPKEDLLSHLQSYFDDSANVEYDKEHGVFVIKLKGETAQSIALGIEFRDAPGIIENWKVFVDSFVQLSKSMNESYGPGAILSVLNPNNEDNTILMVVDGEVFYDFMDEP